MKYILLVTDSNSKNMKNLVSNEKIKIFNLYKQLNPSLFIRIIRKIIYFASFKFCYFFYDDWYSYLKNPQFQFIIFDDCKPFFRLAKIFRKAINRPIVYYWNPIKSQHEISFLSKYFNVYTYSISDSIKYNLKYNHSFCVLPDININENHKVKYDTVFIGVDKGRASLLLKYGVFFNNPYFWVVKDNTSFMNNQISYKDSFLDYNNYITIALQSKSILDLVLCQKYGDTMRIAESILLDKKLITNKSDIKMEKYYHENNILIVNEATTKKDVQSFLSLPFVNYTSDEKKFFSIEARIERF